MTITALPDGAALSRHGTVEVRHYPHDDTVVLQTERHLLTISDKQGRDLAEALAELFPSMALEAQHHDLDGGA